MSWTASDFADQAKRDVDAYQAPKFSRTHLTVALAEDVDELPADPENDETTGNTVVSMRIRAGLEQRQELLRLANRIALAQNDLQFRERTSRLVEYAASCTRVIA